MKRVGRLFVVLIVFASFAGCSSLGMKRDSTPEWHPGHPGHEVH